MMDLDEIAAVGGQQEQREHYKGALEAAVASGDAAACKRFVDHGAVAGKQCRMPRCCDHDRRQARRSAALPPPPLPPPLPPLAVTCSPPLHSSPAVLSDAVPLALSRTLLMAFAQSLQRLAPDVQQAVAT